MGPVLELGLGAGKETFPGCLATVPSGWGPGMEAGLRAPVGGGVGCLLPCSLVVARERGLYSSVVPGDDIPARARRTVPVWGGPGRGICLE